MTKSLNSDGEANLGVFIDEQEVILCKDEPPETMEYNENSQSFDNTFEHTTNYPFEEENFESAVTIDKRDFDAIFLDEFSTDCDIKEEKVISTEINLKQSEHQNNFVVTHANDSGSSVKTNRQTSQTINTTAKHISQILKKMPAESSNVNLCIEESEAKIDHEQELILRDDDPNRNKMGVKW